MQSQEQAEPVSVSRALEQARGVRHELHQAIVALEKALAAPLPHRIGDWAEGVHSALVGLGAELEHHIAATEGPDGLFDEVMAQAPRLANALEQLRTEHEEMRVAIADELVRLREVLRSEALDDAVAARERLVGLLSKLARHRQHGADLVYESYAVDIGVGD